MPNPVYLPPGVDPTQIERPLAQPGCFRWVWLIVLLVGGCGGFSLAAGLFSHPTAPAIAAVPTVSRTPTATTTPAPLPLWGSYNPPPHPNTATPAPTSTPVATVAPVSTPATCWYWHKVIKGETLGSVAAHFQVSQATIRTWNSIPNPNYIIAGFYIRIMIPCPPAATPTLQDIPQSEVQHVHQNF